MKDRIWIIGSGAMSIDYAKVLKALNHPYLVIGRGKQNASIFIEKTGVNVILGGLSK
jgi:glutamyl-tRNA reductase